jgi:hypothetical protein
MRQSRWPEEFYDLPDSLRKKWTRKLAGPAERQQHTARLRECHLCGAESSRMMGPGRSNLGVEGESRGDVKMDQLTAVRSDAEARDNT